MEFKDIQKYTWEEYCKNGFLKHWESVKPYSIGMIAELGLISTEVSEAIEYVRKSEGGNMLLHGEIFDGKSIGEELADIMMNTINFAKRVGIDLEKAIIDKIAKNNDRIYMHGKKA